MNVYYHGTKADVNEVMNKPLMKPASNGLGLYLTKDVAVARQYGRVIAFVLPSDWEVDVIRPRDGGEGDYEYVVNQQHTYISFLRNLEDVYTV